MALKLYNTLTRSIEEFKPIDKKNVGLYTCGPTVYAYPHIGNYRAYIFADTLKRTLLYLGYKVNHIMNLTDIDDKTIRDSQVAGKSLKEFTEFFIEEFYKDQDKLNILPPTKYTKATDYVNEMVAIIEKLIEKGYAYKGDDGSIYFSIEKDKDYGKLSHLDISKLKENASGRIKTDEYEKDNIQDFALWKAWDKSDGDVFWETSLGKGRPGWHIECSAMSMKNLGESFDIHTGGIDNMFPHHENEIAQSESATEKPFVKYWMHNGWILVDEKKMSKSLGNVYLLSDFAERRINPIAYRYFLLGAHYRTKLNFTWEALSGANTAYNRIVNEILEMEDGGKINQEYKNKFTEFISEDLGTPQGLALIWEILGDSDLSSADKKATILDIDEVLGLGLRDLKIAPIPKKVKELAESREAARNAKNWALADEIRLEIEKLGYEVKDGEKGYKIVKKS